MSSLLGVRVPLTINIIIIHWPIKLIIISNNFLPQHPWFRILFYLWNCPDASSSYYFCCFNHQSQETLYTYFAQIAQIARPNNECLTPSLESWPQCLLKYLYRHATNSRQGAYLASAWLSFD